MRILLVKPPASTPLGGNHVTAERWAGILRDLGHDTLVRTGYDRGRYDVLVALHALHSHEAVEEFRRSQPSSPVIVALTGTDLYRDLPVRQEARRSLELATRIVALQRKALDALPGPLRQKTRVIYQSASELPETDEPDDAAPRGPEPFRVCVVGHLRPEKDPLRVAAAARQLPRESRIEVHQVGRALSDELRRAAEEEARSNPRLRWHGELDYARTRHLIAT